MPSSSKSTAKKTTKSKTSASGTTSKRAKSAATAASSSKSRAKTAAASKKKKPAKSLAKSTTKSKSKTSAKAASRSTSKSGSKSPTKRSRPVKTANGSTTTITSDKITDYRSAIKWLMSHTDYERMRIVPYNTRTFSLDRMKRLLDVLGNPHDQLKCVQVAGTKGKGSTCAMLSSMLQTCGYTVGLYTSPHLVDIRERIMINDSVIPHNEITEIFKVIAANRAKVIETTKTSGKPAGKSTGKSGKSKSTEPPFDPAEPPIDGPSFFEIMTAAALRYFADQAVDVVILETGLGGRLDSTTAVNPLITAMTHISLDHTNILGKDLESIAREKAGIFKTGVPAISVDQEPEVMAVLSEAAEVAEAPFEVTGKEIEFSYRFEASRELGPHTRVSITTPTSRWEHLAVPLRGEHQAHNCALALSILDKLKAYGFNAPEDKVVEGLTNTVLQGRMEQVLDQPRVIVDGAHNAVSIQALIRALGAHISYDSLVMVFGCGQDKDVSGMLEQVSLGADKIIFTQSRSNARAVEPKDLMKGFADVSTKMCQTADTLEEALKLAARAVSREDIIVVTGSFYLVGEAKKYIADQKRKAQA